MALAQRIQEGEFNGMRILTMRTGAKDVVTVEGSVLGGYNMLPIEKTVVAGVVASLLDAGTTLRSKAELREQLASRGISLSFGSGGNRLYFSASCLPEFLPFLLEVIAECIAKPAFPVAEVKAEQLRKLAEYEQAKTNTGARAMLALTMHLYPKDHPNGGLSIEEREGQIKALKRSDLVSFASKFGIEGAVLSVVGDIDPAKVLKTARTAFKQLGRGSFTIAEKKPNTKKAPPKEQFIEIKDKANIDTYIGVPVSVTYKDAEFLPLTVLLSMLGSRGFLGHLMRTIRVRDGFTYGINAQPIGFEDGYDGMMRIWATFSPGTYKAAVASTRKEIDWFFKNGISEEPLDAHKRKIVGNYAVQLGTTSGMASMLHKIGKEGRSISYIDEYPELLKSVTLNDLKKAAALIDLKNLSLAAAGTKAV